MRRFKSNVFFVLMALLALSPTITALLTWNTSGQFLTGEIAIRYHSLPVVFFEACVVLLLTSEAFTHWTNVIPFEKPHWIMLGSIGASMLISTNNLGLYQKEAWVANAIWLLHMAFALALFTIVSTNHQMRLSHFWTSLVVGSMLYAVLVCVFVTSIPNPGEFRWILQMPGFTNVRHIGYFVAPAIGVLIGWYWCNKPHSLLSLIAIGLLTCFISWTGSRGALVAILGGLIAASIAYPQLRSLRPWLLPVTFVVMGIIASILPPRPDPSFGLIHRFSEYAQQQSADISTGRVHVWQATLTAIQDKPWFGHAAGQYRLRMAPALGLPLNHPHNIFLQMLYQWGIIGASALFALLGSIWLKTFRLAVQKGVGSAPEWIVLNTLLTYSLIDGTSHYPLPILLMIVAVVTILGGEKTNDGLPPFAAPRSHNL